MYENGKMRPVITIPGMEGEGDKGEWWRGWIQLWYVVRTFVNITMYPQYNNNMIIYMYWSKVCPCDLVLSKLILYMELLSSNIKDTFEMVWLWPWHYFSAHSSNTFPMDMLTYKLISLFQSDLLILFVLHTELWALNL
jgi:hypothetical protein